MNRAIAKRVWKALALGAYFSFQADVARAHHSVGHTPGEGIRTLQTQGSSPVPRQRAALLVQAARGTDEPALNTATTYSAAALVALRLFPRLYVEGQFPLVFVDEDATAQPKLGYGDTILGVLVPVGNLTKKDAASWTLGTSVSIPTRTIRFEPDPGRQWTVTPSLRYADSFGRWLLYSQLLVPTETRPTGTAFDVSPALGVGRRLGSRVTVTLGANADVRVLTVCKTWGGSEICPEGRATESGRPHGALRTYAHGAVSIDLSRSWSLFAGGQLPLTERRDLEWSVSAGAEVRF